MHFCLQKNKALKEFTTFGIGGRAAFFAEIKTKEELIAAFLFAQKKDLPIYVLGGGSNLLFDDRGFSGLVIRNRIDFLKQDNCSFQIGAGYSLNKLALETAQDEFSGLEFLLGVPATLGGAIYMNAGAFGHSISEVLEEVEFVFFSGEAKTFSKKELQFGYRFSSLQKLAGSIVSAKLVLSPALKTQEKALSFLQKRQISQPLKLKNGGCIFQNPKGFFAARLIESAGLKGFQIGGAKVSSLHANFIVNQDCATANDVLKLIQYIKSQVFKKHQIDLKEELLYVPFSGK